MKYVYDAPEIEEKIAAWLKVAMTGEICLVLSFLGSGINTRFGRLVRDPEWLTRLSKERYTKAILCDLRGRSNLELELENARKQVDGGGEETLVIVNGWEASLAQASAPWHVEVERWHHETKIGILIVSYMNILDDRWNCALLENISFAPAVAYFGIWSTELIASAVSNLGVDWGVKISEDRCQKIARLSGGIIAIAKRVAWHCAMGETSEIESKHLLPDTVWLMKRLWSSFDHSEQNVILDIVDGKEVNSRKHYLTEAHLRELGLVGQDSMGFQTPLWREFLRSQVSDARWEKVGDSDLIVEGIDISQRVSPLQAKILKELIANKGGVVAKDTLVEKVWGETDVSDWAVDGQISRLRKIMRTMGIDDKKLKTKKGVGYIWQV